MSASNRILFFKKEVFLRYHHFVVTCCGQEMKEKTPGCCVAFKNLEKSLY